MALLDKDILITPNKGQTAEPKIEFKGASSTLGPQTISLNVYPTSNGTVSFEGSAGQLFSITNDLTGTIFSVNDVSGIPSIEVLDTGLIKLAQYSGNVGIGTANPVSKLDVVGTVTATAFTGAVTGNATTATTLQTARTIGGVSFDGSANINLPGVNAAGNQNTSGNAATATNVAYSGLTGTVPTWNQNTTGNAATATTLQTARTINGVSFNGSANITVADSTKLPLAGGTMTGAITFAAAQTWPTFNQSTTGSAATLTTGRTIALTGDVTYTSGSFNGSANVTGTATLASVGTAGTYTKVTTDLKGRVTSGTTLAAADIPALDAAKITTGTIDAARLPSYVDDVIEAANLAAFPATGDTGKIYVALDTNKTYRWSGSAYVYITSGAVDSVAGKTGVVTLVKADVGLGSVDNTADSAKSVSSAATLTTARTLTIGSTGKTFNGSTDVAWTLAEIGAYGASNPSGYLISSGEINRSYRSIIEDTRAAQRTPNDYDDNRASYEFTNQIIADWHSALTMTGWSNGYASWQIIGPSSTSAHENWYLRSGVNTTWNSLRTILHSGNYNTYSPTLTGTGASGSWGISVTGSSASTTGNALTATTLQTARTINGVSFNGSANITVADSTKLPLAGGTMTGAITFAGAQTWPTFNQNTTGSAATITGVYAGTITSSQVTTGLGYTPYNSTNPNSYIALASAITGYVAGTNTALAATDTLLAALGKVQGQITARSGTVTSVGGTGTVSGLSLSGTVTTTGNLTLGGTLTVAASNFASQLANTVLAAPNGAAGVPTFRTLVDADIPELTLAKMPGSTYKQSVRVATTANITLSAPQTIDGIALVAGDRVLVKDQTTTSQNGIYVVAAAAWTRSLDADASAEIGAAVVAVDAGTLNGGEMWTTTFKTTDTLGTTAMLWYEVLYNTGTWGINTTGSAASLTTARTIGGVSFNGTANINLPGVNAAGNQNTTGSAATWTTSRSLWGQSVNGSASITAPLLPAAGTTLLPAFSTSGDTNTGMWFPAADTIAFSEGGVEAMRITSDGLVGIGKSNPRGRLDILGTGTPNANNWIMFEAGNVGATTFPGFPVGLAIGTNFSNGSSETNLVWGQTLGAQQFLSFSKWTGTAVTEQMRIDSSGNLVVGGVSAARARFDIQNNTAGSETATGLHMGYSSIDFYGHRITTTNNPSLAFAGTFAIQRGTGAAWSNEFVINNSGMVGIGVSTFQSAKLQITSTGQGNWANRTVLVESSAAAPSQPGIGFHAATNTSATLLKLYGPTAYMEFRNDADTGFCNTAAASFVVGSDYRIKTDIVDLQSGLQDIMRLSPKKYTIFDSNKETRGFIAHEVSPHIPQAVIGEFNAEDERGFPIYQTLDPAVILATAVAAIQELKALIDQQAIEIQQLQEKLNA